MLINYTLGSNKKKNLIEIRENFYRKGKRRRRSRKKRSGGFSFVMWYFSVLKWHIKMLMCHFTKGESPPYFIETGSNVPISRTVSGGSLRVKVKRNIMCDTICILHWKHSENGIESIVSKHGIILFRRFPIYKSRIESMFP